MAIREVANRDQAVSDLGRISTTVSQPSATTIKSINNFDQVVRDLNQISQSVPTFDSRIENALRTIDQMMSPNWDALKAVSSPPPAAQAAPVLNTVPVAKVRDSVVAAVPLQEKAEQFAQGLTTSTGLKTISGGGKPQGEAIAATLAKLNKEGDSAQSGVVQRQSGLKTISTDHMASIVSDLSSIEKKVPLFTSDPNTLTFISQNAKATQEQFLNAVAGITQEQKLTIMAAANDPYKPPETVTELQNAALAALNKYNDKGKANGDNKLIASYHPELAGQVVSRTIDAGKLAASIRLYLAAEQGGALELQSNTYAFQSKVNGLNSSKAFSELTPDQQKGRLELLYKQAIEDGLGIYVAASHVNALIEHGTQGEDKAALRKWAEGGGMDASVQSDSIFMTRQDVIEFASSSKGQMVIGGSIAAIGIAASIATGGTAAAAGGLIFGVFSITELPQMFSFANKISVDEMKALGIYAESHEYNYETVVKGTSDLIDDLKYNAKTMSPEDRKKATLAAKESYKALGKELADNWVFLQAQGSYDGKLKQYKDMGLLLDSTIGDIDLSSGSMKGATNEPARIKLSPPKGGYLESDEFGKSTTDVVLHKEGKGSFAYKVYDKYGNLVETKNIYYGDGEAQEVSEVDAIAFESVKIENKPEGSESTIRPVTLDVPPGMTATYMGIPYQGGVDGARYLLSLPVGTQVSIPFSKDGFTTDVLNSVVLDEPVQIMTKELEPVWTQAEKPTTGLLRTNFYEGQDVTIDGKQIANPERLYGIDVVPGKHSIVVKEKGKDDYVDTFEVFAGQTYNVAVVGDTPWQQSSSSGGGGGGGGSSGGSSFTKKAADPAPVKRTTISFGASCEGSEIYLDGILTAPVLSQSYDIAPGYHGIVLVKSGFVDWAKNPLLFEGDSLVVNPVFEPLETTEVIPPVNSEPTEATQRVYVNSEPAGSKILVDGGWSGEWTPSYLDLKKGYYLIGIQKSGYKLREIPLWVSDSIAWGELAVSLARAAGAVV